MPLQHCGGASAFKRGEQAEETEYSYAETTAGKYFFAGRCVEKNFDHGRRMVHQVKPSIKAAENGHLVAIQ